MGDLWPKPVSFPSRNPLGFLRGIDFPLKIKFLWVFLKKTRKSGLLAAPTKKKGRLSGPLRPENNPFSFIFLGFWAPSAQKQRNMGNVSLKRMRKTPWFFIILFMGYISILSSKRRHFSLICRPRGSTNNKKAGRSPGQRTKKN